MTKRAMTEGELRTLIAKAISAHSWTMGGVFKQPPISWDDLEEVHREAYRRWADAVLAVLRPHLGLEVTDEQRVMMTTALDGIERAVTEFEGAEQRRWVTEYVSVLRAIAGRGE